MVEGENVVINMSADSPYYRLIVAILKTAVRDYITAVRKEDTRMIGDCERFFNSNWYKEMCNVPGAWLILRLRLHGKKIFKDVNDVHNSHDI